MSLVSSAVSCSVFGVPRRRGSRPRWSGFRVYEGLSPRGGSSCDPLQTLVNTNSADPHEDWASLTSGFHDGSWDVTGATGSH